MTTGNLTGALPSRRRPPGKPDRTVSRSGAWSAQSGESPRMERAEAPLVQALVDLAVLPDDAPELGEQLARLVELVVLRLPAADYASVTSQRGDGFATVALTGQLALAVDQAQYADGVGPCIDATDGFVTAVTDTATVLQWPGFRETAVNLGLRSSLSIPLFTASGVPSIGLNIYSYR